MENKYCQHCWPTKRRSHFIFQLEYYVDKIIAYFLKRLDIFKLTDKYTKIADCRLIVNTLSLFKIISFVDEPDVTKLYNRSLIFFDEAKKRGLNVKAIKLLWFYLNEFRLVYKNKKYHYDAIPITIFPDKNSYRDKFFTKKILQKNNIPVAFGELFTNARKALNFAKTIGFPLVVKPFKGSLSHHVTCPINSEVELRSAIQVAQKYRPAFIIEKFITGNLFRATVVGKKLVFVCQKEKANVVGDGYLTIEELIKLKNSHIDRGDIHQRNTTLHKISIDDELVKNLTEQKLNLASILAIDKKIYLYNKFTLSYGCDIIGCGEKAHADNNALFIKIANILETDLLGIDFICPDISKSYHEQETAVLECNSLPYIDMHQHPSHGRSEPVAEMVWDIVLNRLDKNE